MNKHRITITLVIAVLAAAMLATATDAASAATPRSSPSGIVIMWTGHKLVVRHVHRTGPVAHKADACIWHVTPGMKFIKYGGGPTGGNTFAAQGWMSCPGTANHTISLETCMGQLLSSGWSVVGWSCQSTGSFYGSGAYVESRWVGLTTLRWYCPWIAAQESGQPTNAGYWTGWGVKG